MYVLNCLIPARRTVDLSKLGHILFKAPRVKYDQFMNEELSLSKYKFQLMFNNLFNRFSERNKTKKNQ